MINSLLHSASLEVSAERRTSPPYSHDETKCRIQAAPLALPQFALVILGDSLNHRLAHLGDFSFFQGAVWGL